MVAAYNTIQSVVNDESNVSINIVSSKHIFHTLLLAKPGPSSSF